MEWQQLEYFHAVAKLQHVTRAAEQLAVSQSALSRSIANLEAELGVKLFERKGRGIVLNRFGQAFYAKTFRGLQEIARAKQEMLDLLAPDSGTVSLAFLKSLGTAFVPQLVSAFLQDSPKVQFRLHQHATPVMLDQLEAGEIDFCLSTVTENRPVIEWLPLWTDEIYAYVPASHPLARKGSVTLQELANNRMIALKPGYGTRTIQDRLFEQAGLQPAMMFEGEELVTLIGFVRANLGVALLPAVNGVLMDGIVRLGVDAAECTRTIGLAWNRSSYLSPVAIRFRDFLIAYSRRSPARGRR